MQELKLKLKLTAIDLALSHQLVVRRYVTTISRTLVV
jgi:hypothetical protein